MPFQLYAVCMQSVSQPQYIHACFSSLFIQFLVIVPSQWLLWKTPWQGAQTSIYLATEEGIEGLSGSYFADCKKKKPARNLDDPEKAKELWKVSERLLEIED